VRLNCICPAPVRTTLLSDAEWDMFPPEWFTPLDKIVEVMFCILDGRDDAPAEKTRIDGPTPFDRGGVIWGEIIEIIGREHYYREASAYCNETMANMMRATDIPEMPGQLEYDANN
jgi:hypothetical protein